MSSSMWFWRVVLPGVGLLASLAVLVPTFRAADPRDRAAASPSPGAAAPAAPRVVAEGRVVTRPGAESSVGAEAGGVVAEVPAREGARVRKGDLLVRLLSDRQEVAVAEAEARLAEADADLVFQKLEYPRHARAAADAKPRTTEQNAARRDLAVAEARHRAAAAALAQCRLSLARTRLSAPIDGVVTACLARPGEAVAPAALLVTVSDLSKTRIEAEVDEFDAPRVTVGAAVTVTAEGLGAASWRGTVEEVPDRVGGRSILPEDPGRPTDTRVLLVKIRFDGPHPLKLGRRVEVEILTPPRAEAP